MRRGARTSVGLVAGALAMSSVACGGDRPVEPTGDTTSAIASGSADLSDDGVVALFWGGGVLCSGALVAPDVVLTAAHCLIGKTPSDLTVTPGAAANAPSLAVQDLYVDPDFDGFPDDDIGLLRLSRDAPFAPLRIAASTEWARVDTSVRLIGFGRLDPEGGAGTRRAGDATIQALTPDTFTIAGNSAPCDGDSGGPSLVDTGAGLDLVALISRGDASCAGTATLTRVDLARRPFVAEYLARSSSPTGTRCFAAENCRSGLCIVAPDARPLAYCSAPCDDSDACPSAMGCVGGECVFSSPSPGALGTTCTTDADCANPMCTSPSEDVPSTCSELCGLSRACPAGYSCSPDVRGSSACFPAALSPVVTGGCSIARRGDAETGGMGLVPLLFAAGIARRAVAARRASRIVAYSRAERAKRGAVAGRSEWRRGRHR